ncbi:protein lifeguard 3 [Tribolium castaneum]|uniref:Protein lifeguard 2-like Protein n=1 Tax=Tribolium castaneum TaxID=7070 RepID=A0A139WI54_TRICA|nr:PREDICTED: protein lifeguard 3-like [Tribolium castaneum]KYB27616.1 Protein lifeguard 2-like Protein [Tribolium castaneum]|eukprot:XP_008193148.1 PREDICTED: protein lifeguard 3-like [Tribolium castaneum]
MGDNNPEKAKGEPPTALQQSESQSGPEVLVIPYQQPPPYSNQPPYQPYQPQAYYYPDPSYAQRQTPAYQQRMYQDPYYGGYPPPMNVAQAPPVRQRQSDLGFNFFGGSGEIFTDAFDTVKIRNRFVQRVYTILSAQLAFTFAFAFLATYEKNTKLFLIRNGLPIMIAGMIVFMTVYCCVVCTRVRHQYPLNFILLAILTVAMTLLVMCLTARVPPLIVLFAVGTTAALCLMVSLFAIQTKWDVTSCGMCLCVATGMLCLYGVVIMILSLVGIHMPILHVVYSAIATVIFTFWLMYDTQMIVGGRRLELSPEEYIVGALSLYVDIIYIFIHILHLYQYCMGGRS